jgi:hypothetical protein
VAVIVQLWNTMRVTTKWAGRVVPDENNCIVGPT